MDLTIVIPFIAAIVAAINGVILFVREYRDKQKGKKKTIYFLAILIMILSIIAAGFLFENLLPLSVRITDPINGEKIEHQITVHGTSQNIPKGDAIWIVIYEYADTNYYPMLFPAVIQASGDWTSRALVGGNNDSVNSYDIIAVVADPAAQQEFINYILNANGIYSGKPMLPIGAQIVSTVNVQRINPILS